MRKVFSSLLVMGLLLGGIFQQAQAQDKKLAFNLNIGAQTNSSFDAGFFRITLGVGLDFLLGEKIIISPEFQSCFHDFETYLLNPGAILNLRFNNFFVGGGLILSFMYYENDFENVQLLPKINAGYRSNYTKLTIYLIPPFKDFPREILLGASIGIVF